MTLDHVGKAFFKDLIWLQYIGRLAFPIFAFSLAQGYIHTKDVGKYLKRLVGFAVLSQIPYTVFEILSGGSSEKLNVLFTLLLGLVAIHACDRIKIRWLSIAIVIGICLAGELLRVDYGAYGIATVVLFYYYSVILERIKENKRQRIVWTALVWLCFLAMTLFKNYDILQMVLAGNVFWTSIIIWTVMSFALLIMYNGELGPRCKYLFYLFYPFHLTVICLMLAI